MRPVATITLPISALLACAAFSYRTVAHAEIPTYELMASGCGGAPMQGKAFAVKPFGAAVDDQKGEVWIIAALHTLHACSHLQIWRPDSHQRPIRLPSDAYVWIDRDLVAFPVTREAAQLTDRDALGEVDTSLNPDDLEGKQLVVWTNGPSFVGGKRFVNSQTSYGVGELRRKLDEAGLSDSLGGLSIAARFLEYSAQVGEGDSGAPVTRRAGTDKATENVVVGVHLAGTRGDGKRLPQCWALVLGDQESKLLPQVVKLASLQKGIPSYIEPALGQALKAHLSQPRFPVATVVVSSAGVVGAAVLFGIAVARNAELNERCPNAVCSDASASSIQTSRNRFKYLSFGTLAATGVAALVVWSLFDRSAGVSPEVSPTSCGVRLSGEL